jgi:hypothetical protein
VKRRTIELFAAVIGQVHAALGGGRVRLEDEEGHAGGARRGGGPIAGQEPGRAEQLTGLGVFVPPTWSRG